MNSLERNVKEYSDMYFRDFSDVDGYALLVSCVEVPEVIISDDKIKLKIKQNYQFFDNGTLIFDRAERKILSLRVLYRYILYILRKKVF